MKCKIYTYNTFPWMLVILLHVDFSFGRIITNNQSSHISQNVSGKRNKGNNRGEGTSWERDREGRGNDRQKGATVKRGAWRIEDVTTGERVWTGKREWQGKGQRGIQVKGESREKGRRGRWKPKMYCVAVFRRIVPYKALHFCFFTTDLPLPVAF